MPESGRGGAEVCSAGFDGDLGTYTRTYGSTDLDAALLILPLVGLEPASSPRVRSTVHAIRDRLRAGADLLYRYEPGTDDLPGKEGAFLPCSFWLVQALARIGEVADADQLFDTLVARARPLGLLPEEIDPPSGSYLGNHPQALTHAAMIQAALALRDADRGFLR